MLSELLVYKHFVVQFRCIQIIQRFKIDLCPRDVLCKDLFIVDEVFLRCLVEIKGLFEMAKKNTRHKVPGSPIVLTKVDYRKTTAILILPSIEIHLSIPFCCCS